MYGIKSYLNSIKEDFKSIKMRPSAQAQIKAGVEKKRQELNQLLGQMKQSFGSMGRGLKSEYNQIRIEMSEDRESL